MPIHGKQIQNASISDAKMVESYTKADGTRAFTGDQSMGGFKLTSLAAPTAASDAARKADVDAVAAGLAWKDSVRAASTANLDLSSMPTTIDGITMAANDRFLAKDQTTGSQNGVYVFNGAASAATRSTDADTALELEAAIIAVEEGTANANTHWQNITDNFTLDTDALTFQQFTGFENVTAGAGITKTGNTINVGDAGKGVQVNADDLELSASEAASTGLEASANSWQLRIAAQGNGLTGGAGTTLSVLAANESVNVSGSGVKAAVLVKDNKNMTASVTTADGNQATATTVVSAPTNDSHVRLAVNGIEELVGDGTKVAVSAYVSNDGGTTARAWNDIAAADTIHWNGTVAGYELAATDKLSLHYMKA